jgi:NADPH:quinone reductase-like Zn-dependent oxidoreductase
MNPSREILTMKAVRLHEGGALELEEIDVPALRPGEVLVRVHAAAITNGELGWPTDRLPAIPSYELSGVVVDVAADVSDFGPGDEVYALTPFDRDGVAAEYAVVPAAVLAPKPRTLDHVKSAAVPMTGLTAWQGLFERGVLEPGQRVQINGARGGVGHIAVQLARLRGADPLSDGPEPDLVFDTIGGDVLAGSSGRRIVSVAEEQPGVTYFIVEPNRDQLVELARLVDDGELRPEIDSVFPLTEARAAFERVAARGKRGKVVLRVADE